MTTDEVLKELEERGLYIALVDGKPRLRGPVKAITHPLLAVLRHHREEIIRRMTTGRLRQFLWRSGHVYEEVGTEGGSEWQPIGAWWWRYQGEKKWKVVPGAENVSVHGHRLFTGEGLPEGEQLDGEVSSTRRQKSEPEPTNQQQRLDLN